MNLYNIREKNILVIGDIMLDEYFFGDVARISPEAPVPVFQKKSARNTLGGAANVAANLVAAGQNVSVAALVGDDGSADILKKLMKKCGINIDLVIASDRSTTVKTRFLANNNQQVMRLDVENNEEISPEDGRKMSVRIDEAMNTFDLIVMSDYMKGVLGYDFTQKILNQANSCGIPVIIDVKDPVIEKYKGAYLLKPNLQELRNLTGMPAFNDAGIVEASAWLQEKCHCRYVLTTCGPRGMVLIGDGKPYFIGSANQEVFDVTGAGDTSIAYLAASLANGYSIRESVEIANHAAGIQVGKVGTSSVYWHEVRKSLYGGKKDTTHKALTGRDIEEFRESHKKEKIVFTNGCFDILHTGHVRYLREAAKLGDILVVGLNSDKSVQRIKGSQRPINNENDRKEVLCALGFVDYVAVFEEDTPYKLISTLQPDILVKGEDYNFDDVVGKNIVEERGGKLVLIPLVEGKSTTNIINKIKSGQET